MNSEFRIQNPEPVGRRTAQSFREISIAANIAEGFKKRGRNDKARFLNIAQGSVEECRYYLLLTQDPGYGEPGVLEAKLTEVSKLLEAYTRAISNSNGENRRSPKLGILNSEF